MLTECRDHRPDLQPADRIRAVQSPIIPIMGQLVRDHPGTISLGQGVVYYGPPEEALDELSAFGRELESHRYSAVQGIPGLLEALAVKLRNENGMDVDPLDRVVVTAGANMGFMNAILAVCDPGDEVILQSPYYFNHEMAVAMTDCRPIIVPTDAHYQLQLDRIQDAITPRTRTVVTISPNNPTGAVYSEQSLRELNQLCRERGIFHISDEAYEYFLYDDARHYSPGRAEGSAEHTISLFSLSKSYGFAGWRIGWMVIPPQLMESVKKVQDTNLICPPVVSQHAAVGALRAGADYCRRLIAPIARVRRQLLAELAGVADLCEVPASQGAFYLLLRVHTSLDSLTMAQRLVREHGIAVIPGSAFGMHSGCFLRVAFAALEESTAMEGIHRLVRGIHTLASASPLDRGH